MNLKQFYGICKLALNYGHEWANCLPEFSIYADTIEEVSFFKGKLEYEIDEHGIPVPCTDAYILYGPGDEPDDHARTKSTDASIYAILKEVERRQDEYRKTVPVKGIHVFSAFDIIKDGNGAIKDIEYSHTTQTGREQWWVSKYHEIFEICRPDPLGGHVVLKGGREVNIMESPTFVVVAPQEIEDRHWGYLKATMDLFYNS